MTIKTGFNENLFCENKQTPQKLSPIVRECDIWIKYA